MLIGGNVAVAAVVLAAGLGYLYVKLRLGEINSVNIPGLTAATSGATNILVVGSDTRSNLTDPNARNAFGAGTNATAGQRSDVTMVLHIDPKSKQASVLSIPRDLYVPIAGTNRSDRINSSFGNGPQQLIQTIQTDLGIPVHHFVSMNFDGFQGLVNAVGGIDVNFPDPAKDAFSGLNITKTGCQHLDGAAALSLEVFEVAYLFLLLGAQVWGLINATDTAVPAPLTRLWVAPPEPPPARPAVAPAPVGSQPSVHV